MLTRLRPLAGRALRPPTVVPSARMRWTMLSAVVLASLACGDGGTESVPAPYFGVRLTGAVADTVSGEAVSYIFCRADEPDFINGHMRLEEGFVLHVFFAYPEGRGPVESRGTALLVSPPRSATFRTFQNVPDADPAHPPAEIDVLRLGDDWVEIAFEVPLLEYVNDEPRAEVQTRATGRALVEFDPTWCERAGDGAER